MLVKIWNETWWPIYRLVTGVLPLSQRGETRQVSKQGDTLRPRRQTRCLSIFFLSLAHRFEVLKDETTQYCKTAHQCKEGEFNRVFAVEPGQLWKYKCKHVANTISKVI